MNPIVSVIIPAYKEKLLNKTIDMLYKSAKCELEVLVGLNSEPVEPIDERAKVIDMNRNAGERVAMNACALAASGEYLLRIDGHCRMAPVGWDAFMVSAVGREV